MYETCESTSHECTSKYEVEERRIKYKEGDRKKKTMRRKKKNMKIRGPQYKCEL